MNSIELANAAALIAKANANAEVAAVTAVWDEGSAKLVVTYYVDGAASGDALELCELTLTELLAEFADVKLADIRCIRVSGDVDELQQLAGLVYLR